MKRFIERMAELFHRYSDRPAFTDSERVLTYGMLDEESAKIYSYLRDAGIGRESFVLIKMPRSASVMSCIFGVLKSGGAFVCLEDTYPEKRVSYIDGDVNASLTIDLPLYEEIMKTCSPLPGYETTGVHDAAYAVYTSGSTGNPKGVLHEYGNLDLQAGIIPEKEEYEEYPVGLISPFYFVATWYFLIHYMLQAYSIRIISADVARNFSALSELLIKERIRGIFLTPSYARKFTDPGPYLEEILTAGEPASHLYFPGGRPRVRNLYTMSEAGFTVLETILDKEYDIAPVGKPLIDIDVHLVDDSGNRLEGAGEGELCFRNEYVRGYINLPDKTDKVFIGTEYRTGDIARRDESGNYYILGRNDDMFKINGNRIEPAEIESRVMELTGLTRAVAKGFRNEERAYICLYYLKEEAERRKIVDGGELQCSASALGEMLPDYMIPAYYIGLDAFPMNANGKLAKKLLPEPDIRSMRRVYAAPETETQKLVCSIISKILRLDRVGLNDDFYLIGGDSISSIMFVSECAGYGYDLSASEIFKSRTVEKIAAVLDGKTKLSSNALAEREAESRKTPRSLLPVQRKQLELMKAAPDTTVFNLHELIVLDPDVDCEKLARAVDKVFAHHPALLTRIIVGADGTAKQVYDRNLFENTPICEVSETELDELKKTMVRPYDLSGKLCRSAICKTPSGSRLFVDMNHLISDGTSRRLVLDEIYDCYEDEDHTLPEDCWYSFLAECEAADTAGFTEEEEYYGRKFGDNGIGECSCLLDPDLPGGAPVSAAAFVPNAYEKKTGRGNLLYLTACAMAAAKTNGSDRALVYCVYHGRDDARKNVSVGEYACIVPIYLVIGEDDTPKKLMEKVTSQLDFGTAHCRYPYEWLNMKKYENELWFNYQKDTLSIGKMAGMSGGTEKLESSGSPVCTPVIFGLIDNTGFDALSVFCGYGAEYYSREKIEELQRNFTDAVESLERENG
ncbi:MAG: non-ribosomal peptide synthetase [Eubacteriales bacterium]|nr:non-ribosomal peptide synthetase [Eubacteriales bacterium]